MGVPRQWFYGLDLLLLRYLRDVHGYYKGFNQAFL
jgi:hypothetical protein